MGARDVDASGEIETNWGSVEVRNEFIEAQIAGLHSALGVPQEHLWESRLGYTPDEVKQFKRARNAERTQRLAAVLGSLNSGPITETAIAGNGSGGAVVAGRSTNGTNGANRAG